MTMPGTKWLANERIHPGLPAHPRNHDRALLVVGFDRRERLGVPASAQQPQGTQRNAKVRQPRQHGRNPPHGP
jgi:hypothetical protein